MQASLLRRPSWLGWTALVVLLATLVGCGASVDKQSSIRADEALYTSFPKPHGLHLERRNEGPDKTETDATFLQDTTGWWLDYNYKVRPDDPSAADLDVIFDFVRHTLPADWRCETNAPGGGGWCWSPDHTRNVEVDHPVNAAARAGDTVRIGVDINTEPTSEQLGTTGTPAHA